MTEKTSWERFCEEVISGEYQHQFTLEDKHIVIYAEERRSRKKIKQWVFGLHKHDESGYYIYSIYRTPQLLLENVRVDGKGLQEIWGDLKEER